MVQIQNHQKLVKNAKIGDFWGKFTSKSGDALKSSNFNDILRQIVTSFFVVLSKKIQSRQMTQIKNCQNCQKLCENAKITKLTDFTVLPDLDVDFPENCQFWRF